MKNEYTDINKIYERDNDLLKRLRSGEPGLNFVIAENYRPMAIKYAGLLSINHPDIETDDLVQEAMLHISEKIQEYDDTRSDQVIQYVYYLITKSIRNQLRTHRKRTKRLVSLFKTFDNDESFLIEMLEGNDHDPSDRSVNGEIKSYVDEHISYLDDLEQKIVYGVLEKRSFKDIAKELDLSHERVKSKFQVIQRKLKNSMKEKDVSKIELSVV